MKKPWNYLVRESINAMIFIYLDNCRETDFSNTFGVLSRSS